MKVLIANEPVWVVIFGRSLVKERKGKGEVFR
jgi:hypothetical protein